MNIQDFSEAYTRYKDKRYTRLRERQRWHESILEGTVNIGLEKAYFTSPTIPPTARRIIKAPVDNIAMDEIRVHVEPLMKPPHGLQTEAAKKKAGEIERWLQAVVDRLSKQPPYFMRELIDNFAAFGEGGLEVWMDPELVRLGDKYQEEHGKKFPFAFLTPNPKSLFMSLDMVDGAPLERYKERTLSARSVRQMAKEFGSTDDPVPGAKGDELVTLVEGQTSEERCYFAALQSTNKWQAIPVNGEDKVVPNLYGFVPYSRGFSGYGRTSVDGDPADLSVGILTGLERLLVEEARLLTMLDTLTAKHAAPTIVITVPDGMTLAAGDAHLDMSPGKALIAEKGITYEQWNPPPVPQGMMEQLRVVQQQLEAFMPGIVTGMKENAGEAAISKSVRLNQANLQWECMYISGKNVIANALMMVLKMVKVANTPVEVEGFKLTPDDVDEQYQITVDVKPGNPDQQRLNLMIGKDMKGELPERMIAEKFYGVEDVEQFQVDLTVDAMMKRPDIQGEIARQTLEEFPIEQANEQMKASQGGIDSMQAEADTMDVPGIGGSPTRGVMGAPNMGAMQNEQQLAGLRS